MTALFRLLLLCLVPLSLGAQEGSTKPAPNGAAPGDKSAKGAGAAKADPKSATTDKEKDKEKKGTEADKKGAAAQKPEDPAKGPGGVTADGKAPLRELPSSMDSLFKLIPVDRKHEGVHFPVMDGEDVSAIIDSEFVTRKDENILEFENATINQMGVKPMTFRFRRAVYNKATGQLMSNLPSTVESKTYRIEGDRMNFDQRTGISRMEKTGQNQVRMTVFDLQALDEPPAPVEGAAAPTPEAKAPAADQKPPADAGTKPAGADAKPSPAPAKDQPAPSAPK